MSRGIHLADALEALYPEVNYRAQPFARNIITAVMFLEILACVKFMWDIRHANG